LGGGERCHQKFQRKSEEKHSTKKKRSPFRTAVSQSAKPLRLREEGCIGGNFERKTQSKNGTFLPEIKRKRPTPNGKKIEKGKHYRGPVFGGEKAST